MGWDFINLCENIYQEAIAIGRTFAAMKGYALDGNKEMVALASRNHERGRFVDFLLHNHR